MAEHQEQRASKKSKGLFGKLHRKGKMRYQQVVLDDEEHLMCDDKHEINNDYTVKMQSNDKAENACDTRKRQTGNETPVKEGSMLETEIRDGRLIQTDSADAAYHSGVLLTDINLFESDIISAAAFPENACVVRVNAIIECSNDNNNQRYQEESEVGFLVTENEPYKSDSSLLQNEKSTITRHFDNLSVSHVGTSAANGEGLEAQTNSDADYEARDRPNQARLSRAKENAVKVDHVEDSPMSEPTPRISTPANYSKHHGKEGRRKKRKAKAMRKSNRNSKTSEATSDEETPFYVHSSGCRDSETIEILTIDTETKKEKTKKRRKKAKRIVTKAGLTMWKGIRTGWKLMWDGLSMYTLPLGTLDVTTNITKFWSANNSSATRA